jgi:hypothetical protein
MDETNIPVFQMGNQTIEISGTCTVNGRKPICATQSATACLLQVIICSFIICLDNRIIRWKAHAVCCTQGKKQGTFGSRGRSQRTWILQQDCLLRTKSCLNGWVSIETLAKEEVSSMPAKVSRTYKKRASSVWTLSDQRDQQDCEDYMTTVRQSTRVYDNKKSVHLYNQKQTMNIRWIS